MVMTEDENQIGHGARPAELAAQSGDDVALTSAPTSMKLNRSALVTERERG